MDNKLFKGTFNHVGVTYTLYTHAGSSALAFYNFITQLHKKTDVPKRTLMFWFDGSRDNYYIKEEVKKDESKNSEKDSKEESLDNYPT